MRRGDVFTYPFPNPDKSRPVVILTRDGAIHSLTKLIVAPITSTRRGSPAELMLDESDGMKVPCAINLYNVMTVHTERLGQWRTTLSAKRMDAICKALRFALDCDCP